MVYAGITRRAKWVFMSLAFGMITFLPSSNVFFYVGFLLAERVLYVPSIGFCLVVGWGCVREGRNPRK